MHKQSLTQFTTRNTLFGALLALSLIFTGCGGGGDNKESADTSTPKSKSSSSGSFTDADVVKEIVITGNDQMKYNISEFTVPAGGVVKVTLNNVGTMPKASMGHNVVILNSAIDPDAFVEAASTAAVNDYIPKMYEYQLIAHTKMTGGGESASIIFRAPKGVGEYPFLCSFPGHYGAGMKGVMKTE